MSTNTLAYVIITVATLIFCGMMLFFTHDQGTHDAVLIMAGLAIGHWFGYSNQLVNPPVPTPVTPTPATPATPAQ